MGIAGGAYKAAIPFPPRDGQRQCKSSCAKFVGNVILGAASVKNWEVWGKKENLLFLSPLQFKSKKKGEEILSALCPICSQPPAGHDLPNWIDQEKRLKKKKKSGVSHEACSTPSVFKCFLGRVLSGSGMKGAWQEPGRGKAMWLMPESLEG